MTAPSRALEARDLEKVYRVRPVVNGVSLEVHPGEVVGLLGPNGAGKTTTFYMISGIVRPNRGRIMLNDKNITGYPQYRRAKAGIGYLSQEPSIFRKLTVEQNLMAILQTMKMSRKQMRQRLADLLEEFGIGHLAKQKAFTLSGGERRRVEISRSLVTNPSFILMDEPFSGIDPIAVEDIQNTVSQLRERDLGVLITDHNVRETLEITDRAYLMYEGRVLISGTAADLISNPQAKKLYLGERFQM
ncbi:LPS export ABC transporter ATP-binding protein [candidate division KSB1 bacterium]